MSQENIVSDILKNPVLRPKFDVSDFPFSQLETVGMKRAEVLNLPGPVLDQLKSGNRTELQNIVIQPEGMNEINLQARLSFKRNQDGSLNLNIHPIRKEIQNTFNLSSKEIKELKEGKTLLKNLPSMNGEQTKSLIQLDKTTNEILTTRRKDIIIPDRILTASTGDRFLRLSQEQKELLKNGNLIELENPSNAKENFKISLDFNSVNGYSATPIISNSKELNIKFNSKLMTEIKNERANLDKNQNGVPDKFESDVNRNGVPDKKEIYESLRNKIIIPLQELSKIPDKIVSFSVSNDQKRELLFTGKTELSDSLSRATVEINDKRGLSITQGTATRSITSSEVSFDLNKQQRNIAPKLKI